MSAVGSLPLVASPSVTLVEGSSFAISSATGDMSDGGVHGLYVRDSRVVSAWRLLLDDAVPEPLAAHSDTPFAARFLSRRKGEGPSLTLERHRLVGNGMREDLVLRNPGPEAAAVRVTVELDTDFADLFSVKESHPVPLGEVSWATEDGALYAEARGPDTHRGVRVGLEGAVATGPGRLVQQVVVPACGRWSSSLIVTAVVDGEELPSGFPPDEPFAGAEPAVRFHEWRESSPVLEQADQRLTGVLDQALQDLGALRVSMKDGEGEWGHVVAAGAPWFMTLFGRDSLLSAWMALPVDQELALSTLRVLARLQGDRVDPLNEEEPGRILHEIRHGQSFPLSPGHAVYYGTADATPLFCMLVGELHRWGVAADDLRPLMPHVDRALDWITTYGDRDGDGFVEYKRATDKGLFNQGWKDSHDSISFRDGRLAEPPIALAEVQAYVYGAFVARGELARTFDDGAVAREWSERAAELRRAFHERFWLPEQGYVALALDGDKRPVDGLASNMGHCLWTGLLLPDVAEQVMKRLLSPELFSGWGIRTLATSMRRYDPVSYHNGSVWPHDTALCVAGLARYGFREEAAAVTRALVRAGGSFGGRLPELFCGFDRAEFRYPVPYPTSCSPQAWAAATPFLLMRSLLGFEPELPGGRVFLDPHLPEEYGEVVVRNLPLAGHRVVAHATGTGGRLEGLPDGVEVAAQGR